VGGRSAERRIRESSTARSGDRTTRSRDSPGPSSPVSKGHRPMTRLPHPRTVHGGAYRSVGSGKSTFVRRHPLRTVRTLSSELFRGGVERRERSGRARRRSRPFRFVAGKTLEGGCDGNRRHQREGSMPGAVVSIAREHDVMPVAVVLDVPPERVCRTERGQAERPRFSCLRSEGSA